MRTAGRRSNVHGLVEVDVTEARRRIEAIEAETGESLSLTVSLGPSKTVPISTRIGTGMVAATSSTPST